ncbi:MAG: hypothetical protein Q8R65_05780 [Polynucleobacter sp.]|nr:hypothetical protein [Polynucleobacter sp.]
MIANELMQERQDYLLMPKKVYGICLVFEEGFCPEDSLIESVINWAKSARTLGFVEDPYDIEFDDDDFGDGIMVSLKWGQEIDAISLEIIELVSSFFATNYPNSGCKEVQVCISMGSKVIAH